MWGTSVSNLTNCHSHEKGSKFGGGGGGDVFNLEYVEFKMHPHMKVVKLLRQEPCECGVGEGEMVS